MNPFDVMYAQATGSGGGGGGGSGIPNLIKSDIEVGTLDQNGVKSDNAYRLRTADFTTLGPGTYYLFFTPSGSGVSGTLLLTGLGFRYQEDGTFVERFPSGGSFTNPAIKFTVSETQKFKFAFNSSYGNVLLNPEDLHNLILVAE